VREGDALVWGEVEAHQIEGACDRTRLRPAETLVVWSTPPGRSEWLVAIETVHPRTVVLFCIDPEGSTPDSFLRRLAGLARYALRESPGPVPLARLAGATGQREAAVRKGLEWLEKRGLLQARFGEGDTVQIAAGNGLADSDAAEPLYKSIQALLEETAAYRKFFRSAEAEYLV
jgi:hypothetical protein